MPKSFFRQSSAGRLPCEEIKKEGLEMKRLLQWLKDMARYVVWPGLKFLWSLKAFKVLALSVGALAAALLISYQTGAGFWVSLSAVAAFAAMCGLYHTPVGRFVSDVVNGLTFLLIAGSWIVFAFLLSLVLLYPLGWLVAADRNRWSDSLGRLIFFLPGVLGDLLFAGRRQAGAGEP